MTDALALNCISTFAIVITGFIVAWQVIVMRRDSQAQAYGVAREILQDEKVRDARGIVFQLNADNKSIDEWSDLDKKQAEIVCHTYDSVGQMVRYNLLRKDIIIDSWGGPVRRMWPIVKPLVIIYRKDFGVDEYWDDFEWLYKEAKKAEAAMRVREKY